VSARWDCTRSVERYNREEQRNKQEQARAQRGTRERMTHKGIRVYWTHIRCVRSSLQGQALYPLRATMSLTRSVGLTTASAKCLAKSLFSDEAAMRPMLAACCSTSPFTDTIGSKRLLSSLMQSISRFSLPTTKRLGITRCNTRARLGVK